MPYELTLIQKSGYLHAVVTGENTVRNVAGYLEELRRESVKNGCRRLLIEERLEGPRLGFLDVFQIVAEESRRKRGPIEAIAYVDVNAEGDLMKFAENVAFNRFMHVKAFSSVREAEDWLLAQDRK